MPRPRPLRRRDDKNWLNAPIVPKNSMSYSVEVDVGPFTAGYRYLGWEGDIIIGSTSMPILPGDAGPGWSMGYVGNVWENGWHAALGYDDRQGLVVRRREACHGLRDGVRRHDRPRLRRPALRPELLRPLRIAVAHALRRSGSELAPEQVPGSEPPHPAGRSPHPTNSARLPAPLSLDGWCARAYHDIAQGGTPIRRRA